MGYRNSGEYMDPQEIKIKVCDACGKDMADATGRSFYPHYDLEITHKDSTDNNDSSETFSACCLECLHIVLDDLEKTHL
jgi:hypothetical protein